MNKHWVLVTGATRGFGRALVFEWIKSFQLLPDWSRLLVTGRNESKVSELVEELLNKRPNGTCRMRFEEERVDFCIVEVVGKVLDLSAPSIESDIVSLLEKEKATSVYAFSFLVNNAGTLGPLGSLEDCDLNTISHYFYENVNTTVYLTNQYIQAFRNTRRHVIHISSLAAVEPLEYCGLYCMGKAAKNMQMKMIACEHKDIRTLNYAPGPMETDMQTTLRKGLPSGSNLKRNMEELWKQQQLVAPARSAQKLVGILELDRYENATHIDFYSESA